MWVTEVKQSWLNVHWILTSLFRLTSAPLFTRRSATSMFPSWHAMYRGVPPVWNIYNDSTKAMITAMHITISKLIHGYGQLSAMIMDVIFKIIVSNIDCNNKWTHNCISNYTYVYHNTMCKASVHVVQWWITSFILSIPSTIIICIDSVQYTII